MDQMPRTSITLLPRLDEMTPEFDRICFQVSYVVSQAFCFFAACLRCLVSSVKWSASNRFKSSGRGIPELLIQREDMLQKIKATLSI